LGLLEAGGRLGHAVLQASDSLLEALLARSRRCFVCYSDRFGYLGFGCHSRFSWLERPGAARILSAAAPSGPMKFRNHFAAPQRKADIGPSEFAIKGNIVQCTKNLAAGSWAALQGARIGG
jgi:hypothetical protein